MANYGYQNNIVLIGTRSAATITAVTLGTSYAASTTRTFNVAGMTTANFNFRYGMGASETSNSVEFRFSTSPDDNVYHQIMNEAVSAGTSTLTLREFTYVGVNGTTSAASLPLDIFDKWMKIEAKETGVATNAGNIFVEVTLNGEK